MTGQASDTNKMQNGEKSTPSLDWNQASSWEELVQLNSQFIAPRQDPDHKEFLATPYTPDFEGSDLIPQLLTLHKHGLLVISSRAAQLPEKVLDQGMWEEKKRAQYAEFFVPDGEINRKFIRALFQDEQLQGVGFGWDEAKLPGSAEDDIDVAWVRESASQDSLDDMAWESESVFPSEYESEPHAGLRNITAFEEACPVFCAVATTENDINLLEVIEKHLKGAGVKYDLQF